MSDSNPFDDLDDVETDDIEPKTTEPAGDSSSKPAADSTQVEEQSDEPTTSPDPSHTEATTHASAPPFEYSEVRQRPLYARGETWDKFEDAVGISVVPELRRQGIRDEEKREIHDAVLTLAAEEPERLVEIIAERR